MADEAAEEQQASLGEPELWRWHGTAQCHLCAEGLAHWAPLAQARGLRWEEVDLLHDPAARRAYGQRIPVLTRGARVVAEGRLDAAALRAMLFRELGR